jgi:hypothetical protein
VRQTSLCTGGHFQGPRAKREYAKHIEVNHRGELIEAESNLDLQQCKTCGKVTYMGEKAARKHQGGCAAQPPAVQARRCKEVTGSREVTLGWRCSCKHERKWQGSTFQQENVRAEGSASGPMTDAQIGAFFGTLGLNAANSTSLEALEYKLPAALGAH